MTIRVRFPPSPTGHLHVGGARTALFNWLFVRKHEGVFVLRIEDTDRDRSNTEHSEGILEALEWLGIDWDEGPYFQSDGVSRHRSEVEHLLKKGLAYRDFSDPEELAMERFRCKEKESGKRNSRTRAELVPPEESERRAAEGESHAIRFKVPDGQTIWKDLVHGEMKFENADVEDLVILRSDGSPTYNFAVTSDDASQRITHVIRGDDHLSNTAKQILIYNAMGWEEPVFAHVPMILGPDGRRLSKRHGATSIQDYREDGILADALINFLALLGWSPGDDREFMNTDELIDNFSLERVLKKSSVFDIKKLEWLSGKHFDTVSTEKLALLLSPRLEANGITNKDILDSNREWYHKLIDLLKTRARTMRDLVQLSEPFFKESIDYDENAIQTRWLSDIDRSLTVLRDFQVEFEKTDWNPDELEAKIRWYAGESGLKLGEVIHPLRVAVTGRDTSPSIFEVLNLLGNSCVLARLGKAIDHLQALAGEEAH